MRGRGVRCCERGCADGCFSAGGQGLREMPGLKGDAVVGHANRKQCGDGDEIISTQAAGG